MGIQWVKAMKATERFTMLSIVTRTGPLQQERSWPQMSVALRLRNHEALPCVDA